MADCANTYKSCTQASANSLARLIKAVGCLWKGDKFDSWLSTEVLVIGVQQYHAEHEKSYIGVDIIYRKYHSTVIARKIQTAVDVES